MDYNHFHLSSGASVGYDGGLTRATLTDWRVATGKDANSLSADPLFVNAAAGDYHEQSAAGSYHGGAFTADATNSPAIDTDFGDAGMEAAPNSTPLHLPDEGLRNLGAYGGTEQASRTPSGRGLRLYTPIGRENYLNVATPVAVRWTWVGTNWQNNDTVNLAGIIQPTLVANNPTVALRGQWHLQGETNWHDSGQVLTNLAAGNQIVEFKTLAEWVTHRRVPLW